MERVVDITIQRGLNAPFWVHRNSDNVSQAAMNHDGAQAIARRWQNELGGESRAVIRDRADGGQR